MNNRYICKKKKEKKTEDTELSVKCSKTILESFIRAIKDPGDQNICLLLLDIFKWWGHFIFHTDQRYDFEV